jgi:hypothetical protein
MITYPTPPVHNPVRYPDALWNEEEYPEPEKPHPFNDKAWGEFKNEISNDFQENQGNTAMSILLRK